MNDPVEILGSTSEELAGCARELLDRGAGCAARIYRCAHREGRFDPDGLGLGTAASAGWRDSFRFRLPTVSRVIEEPTERGALVRKAILVTHDGLEFETVDVPIGTRRSSLCVSTQVGCRMACRFCETGRMGLLRNLTAAEIVGQVVAVRALGWKPRSIVFMGMGEALDNADELLRALRILTDRNGLAFAHDRLTVCTVGHVAGIQRLAELGWKRLNLSISLNAADEETRRAIMPVAGRTTLGELQAALVTYRQRDNFQLGVHYCLMPGINATERDARAVAAFCRPLGRVLVQVIPYNPGSNPIARPPTDHKVAEFVDWLRDAGLRVRRRITKGRGVMAACGQLGDPALRARVRERRTQAEPGELSNSATE
ncbi:MAG: radical SAM protein [Planctomycetes bacterium]|nr:radical SAM protein [Planctomycetota bacterium]